MIREVVVVRPWFMMNCSVATQYSEACCQLKLTVGILLTFCRLQRDVDYGDDEFSDVPRRDVSSEIKTLDACWADSKA